MTTLSFQLTMPNIGSWNGKWSGSEKVYYRTKSFLKKNAPTSLIEKLKDKNSRGNSLNYYYNFGDGWGANVLVELIDAKEAKKRNKISSGFCGYEWMIDSIIKHDKIITE